MTRLYAHASFCVAGLITIVLPLSGCVAPSPQVIAPTPQVIIQGDTPGKEVLQSIELDNCNGKGDAKRIEQRTRSIESTISAEIAATFGASAEVLSAEVQAAVGAATKWGTEQSTSIELVAPPRTRMAFQLVWIGDEQVGIVQNLRASSIPIAFRSFKPTDVRIKSQYDIGCPPTPSMQTPAATPETRLVTPVLSPTARPAAKPVTVRADEVIPKIKGEDGEIERILNWWRVDDYGNRDGQLDPTSSTMEETCLGLAWNTNEFGYHRLVVFQKPKALTFADGGWYVKICVPSNIQISPEDVGRIQADWLGKRYGIDNHPWEVIRIPTLALPTAVVAATAPLKVETEVTMGGVRKTYNLRLNDGELLVGHADKFQGYSRCVAFLIVGPGSFEFWVESGLWDRWINTTPESYQPLLQEQIDTLVNKYQCTPVKTVRLP